MARWCSSLVVVETATSLRDKLLFMPEGGAGFALICELMISRPTTLKLAC